MRLFMECTAEEVKAIRLRTGLNQRDFAKKFKIKLSTVECWENGIYKPKWLQLFAIERIVQLVEEYGEGQYKWVDNCAGLLSGL